MSHCSDINRCEQACSAVEVCTHLSIRQTLQEVGLPTAIGSNEAVSAANGELYAAVLYELHAIEAHAEPADFDVS